MSKRLKRRIHEVCGLTSLSREERVERAQQILADSDEKQAICHAIVGTSFRDIEKALKDIIDERKPSKHQEQEKQELDEVEEFYAETEQKRQTHRIKLQWLLDQEEVNRLLYDSTTSLATNTDSGHQGVEPAAQPTYSLKEAAGLINGDYDPFAAKRKK